MVCDHDDMVRSKDAIEAHVGRYINSLDKAHINVTICGGGNATHVLAAYIGQHSNTKCSILKCNEHFQSFKDALASHDNTIIAHHRDGRPSVEGTVDSVSNSPAEVIPEADVVIISLPANAHEIYFTCIAPYLTAGTIVGVMVAEGGADWAAKACMGAKEDDIIFFGMETLPWACRYEEYAHTVNIRETKQIVNVAVDPPSQRFHVCAVLQYLIGIPSASDPHISLPEYHPVSNILSMTLMNMNAFVHPSIIYCKFKDWDGVTPFPEKPLFYEGVDDFTATTLQAMNTEIKAIKATVGERYPSVDLSNVICILEWLRHAYGDPIPAGADMRTSMNCVCKESGRYAGILHVMNEVEGGFVPDVTYRYFTEDIPCGLVVIKGFAELLGLETPTIITVIEWMQRKMGKEYLVNGRVCGRDVPETKAPQRFGLSLDEIMERYFT